MDSYHKLFIEYVGNPLRYIIEHYPYKVFWDSICTNPAFTLDLIEEYYSKFHRLPEKLSSNSNITVKFIKKYPSYIWNWQKLSQCINIKEVQENPEMPWDYYDLSNNKTLTEEFIEKNISKPWNYYYLSTRRILSEEFIIKYENKNWDWNSLLIFVSEDFIEKYKDKFNEFSFLLYNRKISLDFILKNINRPNEYNLSLYWATEKIIIEYSEFSWDWEVISTRNLTLNFTIQNINKLSIVQLSRFSQHIMKLVNIFPEIEWPYKYISSNPHITEDFIELHIYEDWIWQNLAKNNNLSIEFILRHKDKIEIGWYSDNEFLNNSAAYYNRLSKRIERRRCARCPWVRRDPYRFIVKSLRGPL